MDQKSEPFTIESNTIYPLDWLRERMHGIVGLPTFLERLGLRERRVFRDAIWGWEIIEASQRAKPFNEVGQVDPAVITDIMTRHRGRRNEKTSKSAIRRLSAKDLRNE